MIMGMDPIGAYGKRTSKEVYEIVTGLPRWEGLVHSSGAIIREVSSCRVLMVNREVDKDWCDVIRCNGHHVNIHIHIMSVLRAYDAIGVRRHGYT